MAVCTRVSTPTCCKWICHHKAFITVPEAFRVCQSVPNLRSIPASAAGSPRQRFPPPITKGQFRYLSELLESLCDCLSCLDINPYATVTGKASPDNLIKIRLYLGFRHFTLAPSYLFYHNSLRFYSIAGNSLKKIRQLKIPSKSVKGTLCRFFHNEPLITDTPPSNSLIIPKLTFIGWKCLLSAWVM